MLVELYGRNFRCFRDEFKLSMLATDIDPDDPRGLIEVPLEGEPEPLRLLRCAAIYGPNASGKSTVLTAAWALRYLLRETVNLASDEPLGPFEPFQLDEECASRPVQLGLRAILSGRVYDYAIEFDGDRFLRESLTEIGPKKSVSLFARELQDVAGEWAGDPQFKLLASGFRPNALLLALADRHAPGLAEGIAVGLRDLLEPYDSSRQPLYTQSVAERAHADREGFGSWLLEWLRRADLGIVDLDTEEIAPLEPEAPEPSRKRPRHRIQFYHRTQADPVPLGSYHESLGTYKMAGLASIVHEITSSETGVGYFVDEIGASLHPHLLQAVIRHVNCDVPMASMRGQLIFATHDALLIDGKASEGILRRDQVYLTEKDADGSCRLFSLAEFKERNNLNLRRRYLQGRYGAIPAIGAFGS